MNQIIIDVTRLEPRQKHPAVFQAFDNVEDGHAVVIHNDHDPKPLYYQLLGERGNTFSWTYLHQGPEIWQVEIRKRQADEETVGELAASDTRKAEYFRKLGIDFCCGGRKTLTEACMEKGLDVMKIRQDLHNTQRQPSLGPQLDFNSFTLAFLCDYIVNVHHGFVQQQLPLIEELCQKVAAHHGDHYPFLQEVYEQFYRLRCELLTHLKKEEQIVFPSIRLLESGGSAIGFDSIGDPLVLMEQDHDQAGEILHNIRRLTQGFSVPAGACNSMRLLYHKLQLFEEDMFQHVHLENNILFPKAAELDRKRAAQAP